MSILKFLSGFLNVGEVFDLTTEGGTCFPVLWAEVINNPEYKHQVHMDGGSR